MDFLSFPTSKSPHFSDTWLVDLKWHPMDLCPQEVTHGILACFFFFSLLAQSKFVSQSPLFVVDISVKAPPAISSWLELADIVDATFLAPETPNTPC